MVFLPGHCLSAIKKDFFLRSVQLPYEKFHQSPDGDFISFVLPDLLHHQHLIVCTIPFFR
jgi:hypothetical protein